MRTKVIRIRINAETENRVKSRAGAEGKSMAETVRSMIEKSLDSSSESGPTIDPETVKKEVDSAIRFGLEPALKAITLLRAEISGLIKNPTPDPARNAPGPAPEIKPEVVRFLAEKAARIEELLMRVLGKISGKSVEVVREEISAELSKSPAAGPSGSGPETVRFLAEKAARINALLNGVSSKADMAGHVDRCRQAEAAAFAEMKKLFGG